MSKLNRQAWALHYMQSKEFPGKIKCVSNTFVLDDLVFEDLPMTVSPFIGCNGHVEVHVYDDIGTEAERKFLWNHVSDLFNKQKRAAGFLTPIHSALETYWYNVASTRDKYDVRCLKNALHGVPVLWCGAGMSLGANIEIVREISENKLAYVITGGTGIRILHDNGIVPDLCLAVDPFMQEVERFEGLSEEWQKATTLLASNSLNPICYEGWKGTLIAAEGLNCMSVGEYIEGAHIDKIDEGPVGVTTWMLSLMKYTGANEAWLIGCDLCFGDKGETYAGDLDMTASDYIQVDDYHGKATKTNWIFEADFIGNTAEKFGYTFYNASSGIPIPNTIDTDLGVLLSNKPINVNIQPKKWLKYRQQVILDALSAFRKQLLDLTHQLGDPDVESLSAYVHLLKQYVDIQEYSFWRCGVFNYSLMREVCTANAKLIQGVLDGVKYTGVQLYGPLGAPPLSEPENKIKTGSANFKAVKNEKCT